MKRFLFFVCCLVVFSASAQDLTGIWRGHFNANNSRFLEMMGQDGRYKFEVQIDQRDKAFGGVTYSYLTTVFYGKATAKGTVNPKTKKVMLEEMKIVEVRMSSGSMACIMTCFLQYSKLGDEEYLEGTYTSMNVDDSSNCGRGTVFLRKVTTSDFYKEPFLIKREKEKENPIAKKPDTVAKKMPVAKLTPGKTTTTKTTTTKKPVAGKTTTQKPATGNKVTTNKPSTTKTPAGKPPVTKPPVKTVSPPVATENNNPKTTTVDSVKKIEKKPIPVVVTPPKVLTTRANELVRTIVTSSNEVIINIYDNGTVDNDTISVYLDKRLVLAKKRLTEKALTMKLELNDSTNFHELVMVAENLGEIPPNTSLMVVKAGNKQYEVRITSTEQKNAVVIFKYEKE